MPIIRHKPDRQVVRLLKISYNTKIHRKTDLGEFLNPPTHCSGSYTKLVEQQKLGFFKSGAFFGLSKKYEFHFMLPVA